MSKFVVMRSIEGMEQYAQSQWLAALKKEGHEVAVHDLRSANVDPKAVLPRMVAAIEGFQPEAIFVEGNTGFNLPSFYLHPVIQGIPVAAFWFDDPFRSIEFFKKEPQYFESLRLSNVFHFVHDGHWRKWLKQTHSVDSLPIHLAADPEEFAPKLIQSKFSDCCVFVGTILSQSNMEANRSKLPPVLQDMAKKVLGKIVTAPYAASPYEILEEMLLEASPKIRAAYQKFQEQDTEPILHLRALIWMYGKNEVRRRILAEALKVMPVLMCAGNFEQNHADESELRLLLGDSPHFYFWNTGELPSSEIGSLYSYGKIHLQATDPQSIEGGIPFRVFQTTACGRPLLTDTKPELAECYTYGSEILTFDSEKDFGSALTKAIADPAMLDAVGKRGRERFLREHTWAHRIDYVRQCIQKRVWQP